MRAFFRIICLLVASIAISFLVGAIAIHLVPDLDPGYGGGFITMGVQFLVALYLGIVWIVHIPYFGYFVYKGTFPKYGSCVWVFLTLVITFIMFGIIPLVVSGTIIDPYKILLTIFATMQSISFAGISFLVSRLWRKDVHKKV